MIRLAAPAEDFYPRSPRGERLTESYVITDGGPISIHAPREGSDRFVCIALLFPPQFLSTLPARGATNYTPIWM